MKKLETKAMSDEINDLSSSSTSNTILRKNKNKSYNQPMSKEFRKIYLEELIKFIEEIYNDAKHNLTICEKRLKTYENASNNLKEKVALINSLPEHPLEKRLKQIEFLNDLIPKLLNKNSRDYKEYKQQVIVIPHVHNEELTKAREELASLNKDSDKTK